MNTLVEHYKKSLSYWKGRKIITTAVITRNDGMVIKAGSTGKIMDKRNGYAIQIDYCKECGLEVYVKRVAPWKLRLVEAA